MSETNNNRKQTMSAYQQLSGIINALKSEEISLNDALNKIQLKDTRPTRPYCKVTGSGALALYGISKQPIVLYADQWNKFLKVAKSDYIDNYIKYNESRLKFKKPRKVNSKEHSEESQNDDVLIDENVEDISQEHVESKVEETES